MAEVKLRGIPTEFVPSEGVFVPVSGAVGRFQLTRAPYNMLICGITEDRRLSGISRVLADDKHIAIAVEPCASAHGRPIDPKTGKPVAGYRIDYGARNPNPGSELGIAFRANTWTDERGEFKMTELTPGATIAV